MYICKVINLIGLGCNGKILIELLGKPTFYKSLHRQFALSNEAVLCIYIQRLQYRHFRKILLDIFNMPVVENISLCEYSPALILEGINRQTHTKRKHIAPDRAGKLMLFSRVKKKVFSKFFTIFNYNFVLNGTVVGYEEIDLLC